MSPIRKGGRGANGISERGRSFPSGRVEERRGGRMICLRLSVPRGSCCFLVGPGTRCPCLLCLTLSLL